MKYLLHRNEDTESENSDSKKTGNHERSRISKVNMTMLLFLFQEYIILWLFYQEKESCFSICIYKLEIIFITLVLIKLFNFTVLVSIS